MEFQCSQVITSQTKKKDEKWKHNKILPNVPKF
jgi:hypothetical protein